MVLHTTTRRNTIIALMFIWALVCGGLGWATQLALELEAHESLHEAEVAFDRLRNEALASADMLVTGALAVERGRPVEHYNRSFLAEVVGAADVSDSGGLVRIESPIRTLMESGFALLHFQGTFAGGFTSPQVAAKDDAALTASAIPAEGRPQQASAANWLAALRARHDPSSLLAVLEEAQNIEVDRRKTLVGEDASASTGEDGSVPTDGEQLGAAGRTAKDFVRRSQRLLDIQRANFPADRCQPVLVIRENLQAGAAPSAPVDGAAACYLMWVTPMLPLWLDLTFDGRRQLALVRSVSSELYEVCTLQGVLVDLNRLRAVLEEEVQALLPGARIEPIETGAPLGPDRLRAIPARLVCDNPFLDAAPRLSTGLTWSLGVTWVVTLLALTAISMGTMRQVTMAERRVRFATAVTHELRTPLTSFQLYADLLADVDAADTNTRDKYVQTLRKESKRLAKLVENVFTYSKVGDAKPVLNPSAVCPAELLETIASQSAGQCAAAKKQLIVNDRCDASERIETDPEFVVQVLANLVENACKYSANADDARIWLTASPGAAGGVTFEVEDAGEGVAPGDRRAIFEPFRRIEATHRDGPPGMGLGLALSRYWAQCLGGRLVLLRNTRNDGRFSRFALSLPQSP